MLLFWIIFLLIIAAFLAIDLGVFHKADAVVSLREALTWTFIWIALSLIFSIGIYFIYENGFASSTSHTSGMDATLAFLTGYVIEKSLSLDNIFLFSAIFTFFRIPAKSQHRVLFWGIFGAIVLRGLFIWAGTALIEQFHWVMYVFGAILLLSSFRMIRQKRDDDNQDVGYLVYKIRNLFPISQRLHGKRFFICLNGKILVTPLFVALISVELSDLLFAMDSIPAIFSITRDPFIVYTSNIMAILGLRSLYFALAALLRKFTALKYSIAFILGFSGLKILLDEIYRIPVIPSLLVILVALAIGILYPNKKLPT